MKVTFDIDCTPEEARAFLGLPDVAPMQDALMQQLQDKLAENIHNLDAESLAKTWVPLTMQGWGEVQKMFWSQMNGMNTAYRPGTMGDADDDSRETGAKPKSRRK